MSGIRNDYLNKKRIYYWDNIKGILISLVVLGHFLLNYLDFGYTHYIVSFIYFFHMPAFVFVSGYFSKNDNARSSKSIFKIILIYLIFNTAIMIVSAVIFDTSYLFITPYYSFWYLIAIVFWRLTIKSVEKYKDILFVSIIAALLIGFWSDVSNVFSLARIIVFYPFFIAGYKLSYEKMHGIVQSRKKKDQIISLFLLLIASLISIYFVSQAHNINLNHLTMGSYDSIFDLFIRLIILIIAFVMIISIINLTPQQHVFLLSEWGKNSLSIFVLHRFITFIFVKMLPVNNYTDKYIIYAILISVLTLLFLGTNTVNNTFHIFINKILDYISSNYIEVKEHNHNRLKKFTVLLLLTSFLMIPIVTESFNSINTVSIDNNANIIHNVITDDQINAIENSLSIAFVGDLILLQNQVNGAYNYKTREYDFSPMFEYAKSYLTKADLAIGVLEGPIAGEKAGYSTGNYDDGLPLYLNYPDSFAKAIKDSGIDLVSTANNHLLDKGEMGALRTLDVLDENELMHVGSYRNSTEKDAAMIVEKQGVRIGVLAYTFASNYYDDEYFLRDNPSLTSIIVNPKSKYFSNVKRQVLSDFQSIEEMDNPPDLIMVIPHMGTQFIHEIDEFQETWNEIFINSGADIILGDHSHSVQPVEYKKVKDKDGYEKNTVIINSPGNFANSYIEHDGDATSIVEIYVDPSLKEVIGASVIPMYTHATDESNYRALPIYSILTEDSLKEDISQFEIKRVKKVHEIVTSVMLGTKLSFDQAQDKYYLFPDGYFRQTTKPIEINDEIKSSRLYKLINESKTICFVGDSITAGSRNGGYGWYEPLMATFKGKMVYNEAWDSATTKTLLDNSESIAEHKADLYVIAIGTNDVRYRDKKICAMDSDAYVENINTLIKAIKEKNNKAEYVLISPWLALNNDPYSKLEIKERDDMLQEYASKLKFFSEYNGYLFIDANKAIYEEFMEYSTEKYMLDYIHPNAGDGIKLYSEKLVFSN